MPRYLTPLWDGRLHFPNSQLFLSYPDLRGPTSYTPPSGQQRRSSTEHKNLLSPRENFPEGFAAVLNYKSRPRNQCQFHTPFPECSFLSSATAHIMQQALPLPFLQAFALQCSTSRDSQKPWAVQTDWSQRFCCMRTTEHYTAQTHK